MYASFVDHIDCWRQHATRLKHFISQLNSDRLFNGNSINRGSLLRSRAHPKQSDYLIAGSIVQTGPLSFRSNFPARSKIAVDDFSRRSVGNHVAIVQQNGSLTQSRHCRHAMRDKKDGAALISYFVHPIETLLLEGNVANCQHLIHYEDLSIKMRSDGKSEP